MSGQKNNSQNKIRPVDVHEAKAVNRNFTELSESFLQSPPSFVLRGPIYLVLIILVAAVVYASITQVSIKITGYLTVKGEDYVVQSPVNGTVNLIYQSANNSVKINENLLAIYSQTAFSKEANLSQISQKETELKSRYRAHLLFQAQLDSLSAEFARRNPAFDPQLPKNKPEFMISSGSITFSAADSFMLYGGGEMGLKYSNLRQNILLLAQGYDRTKKAAAQFAVTRRENEQLLQKSFISRQEYLNSEQAHSNAKSELETIARNLRASLLSAYQENYQIIESLNENLSQLERETRTFKQMLAGIEISGNSLILKNRYPGVVTDVYVKTSQMISEGMPLLRIIRDDFPLVGVFYLPVSQIGQVKVGQKVAIRYDAFPFQVFGVQEGEIVSISDDVRAVEGFGYSYEVTIALKTNPEIKLKPGMGGLAEIISGKKRIIEIALAPMAKIFAYLTGDN
ncbi:MAG: HlyD family efflux transporter periplasmic adaptor subunit [Fibrobacter sp.]|nr:HlyD family efflux transporter periplasmic adaptor subunit [Fibrobacter sp.]